MHHKIVYTSNLVKAMEAMDALSSRQPGEEGMGLIYGDPGQGKTTAISYLLNHYDGIFLRANVTWTVTSMLQALMMELDLEPQYRRAPMIQSAIEALAMNRRPIFVDEADYLLRQTDMLDALRDIYDSADVPVLMVMMEESPRLIKTNRRLARFRRRITQWVEFQGISQEDTRKVCQERSEVEITDDLITERLHPETRGKISEVCIAIRKVERFARANDLARVGLAEYGETALRDAEV